MFYLITVTPDLNEALTFSELKTFLIVSRCLPIIMYFTVKRLCPLRYVLKYCRRTTLTLSVIIDLLSSMGDNSKVVIFESTSTLLLNIFKS